MLLAEAVATGASKFHTFDVFMILFTIIISIGLFRLIKAPQRNKFAIGFALVSLLVFLISDYAMVMNWIS
ncbi:hypothetical protein [Paenibacillus sp. sgz500958]|uniref:hypothetical protein n=1 Tax=Paenibacillus sp. sgz500958 TaxID=3242475 RepID=UPI0036D4104A